jgi:hypothetical protein
MTLRVCERMDRKMYVFYLENSYIKYVILNSESIFLNTEGSWKHAEISGDMKYRKFD